LAVLVFALATVCPGAPPQSKDTPKFTAQAELVLVPVIARKDGQHLAALKQEDFTLLEDGQLQSIAVFEEVHPVLPTRLRGPAEFTNVRPSGAPEQMTIIAIDTINTAPLDQAYLKQEIVKFLDSASETGEPFALVAITQNGIHVLQDFTTDPKQVAAAVRRQPLRHAANETPGAQPLDATPCAANDGCPPGADLSAAMRELQDWTALKTNEEPFEIFRDRTTRIDTVSALLQLAQSLRALPGRKTLVWASSGIQALGGVSRLFSGARGLFSSSSFYIGNAGEAFDQNAYLFNLLSSANIAVYPLDARHGANTSFASYDVVRSNAPMAAQKEMVRETNSEIINMFEQIAATTGGKPCYNRTDLANCLKEAAADSHDYYMLGFYLDKNIKPGWHSITVKLNEKAHLRYRSGFLAGSPFDPEKVRLTDLQLAMFSPLNYRGVTMSGQFTGVETKNGKKLVSFELVLPPDAMSIGELDGHLAFDVVAVARDQKGKEAAKLAQRIDRKLPPEQVAKIRSEGIYYSNKLQLAPGSYGVWFVVRDNVSGRTGSALTTLTVR
jgi:VWFA-related protein